MRVAGLPEDCRCLLVGAPDNRLLHLAAAPRQEKASSSPAVTICHRKVFANPIVSQMPLTDPCRPASVAMGGDQSANGPDADTGVG
jgi:hypothetical protein